MEAKLLQRGNLLIMELYLGYGIKKMQWYKEEIGHLFRDGHNKITRLHSNLNKNMKIILKEKYKEVSEFWHPYIVGELNDNLIQIVKLKEKYIWHKHKDGDEMFVAISGVLLTNLRSDRMIKLTRRNFKLFPLVLSPLPVTFYI